MYGLINAALATHTGSFLFQAAVTSLSVYLVKQQPRDNPPLLEEFLYTFQLVVLSFGLDEIRHIHGVWTFAHCLLFIGVLCSVTFRPRVHANLVFAVDQLAREESLEWLEISYHIALQLLSAVTARKYVLVCRESGFLGLATSPEIVQKPENRTSPLQVTVWKGAAIECLVAAVFQLVHRRDPGPGSHLLAGLTLAVSRCAGWSFTGGFGNAAVAAALAYGSTSDEELCFVYILAPLTMVFVVAKYGAPVGDFVRRNLSTMLVARSLLTEFRQARIVEQKVM